MAFADPQSIKVGGTATSLPRTASGTSSGGFTSADGAIGLTIAHNVGNSRNRRTIRKTVSKVAADPLNSSRNLPVSASAYIVLDVPKVGFTATEQIDLLASLAEYLQASSNAAITKLVGGES